MKTINKNRIASLLFAMIMTFSPVIALGQGIYENKTEQTQPALRAGSTVNQEDSGNASKLVAKKNTPISETMLFFAIACLGYGWFVWRREKGERNGL
jgi:hypothetical protein